MDTGLVSQFLSVNADLVGFAGRNDPIEDGADGLAVVGGIGHVEGHECGSRGECEGPSGDIGVHVCLDMEAWLVDGGAGGRFGRPVNGGGVRHGSDDAMEASGI